MVILRRAVKTDLALSRKARNEVGDLAAKNAILIVEYAVLKKQEGYSSVAAALEAARLRFRPILMT